jgi:hypothetical protein
MWVVEGDGQLSKMRLKFAIGFFAFAFAFYFFNFDTVNAFSLNPNPLDPAQVGQSNLMPGDLAAQLQNCNGNDYSYSPAFWQWLSIADDGQQSTAVVPAGSTAPISLRLHFVSAICSSPVLVVQSGLYTESASVPVGAGSVSGAAGNTLSLTHGSVQGDYRYTSYTFNYIPPSAVTSDYSVQISFINKSINRFSDGRYICIALPRPVVSGWDYASCPPEQPSFTLNIDVEDINGCTDPSASNYDPAATSDDGSCVYFSPNIVCPSYPPYVSFSNPNVTVTLPPLGSRFTESYSSISGVTQSNSNWSPNPSTSISVSRTKTETGTRTRTYYVYVTNPADGASTEVNRAESNHTGLAAIPVDYDDNTDNDGTAELDYTSLASGYPYDVHNPVVWYQSRYQQRTVEETVVRTRNETQTRTSLTSSWGPVVAGAWSGWTVSSTSNDQATGNYHWSSLGSISAGTQLPPCYPRNFSARPTASGASLNPNPESPTNSTFSFSIPVDLTVSNGGALRTPTSITASNIPYTVTWNAQGYSNPSYSGTINGTANVSNSSLATSVTRNATLSTAVPVSIGVSIPANIRAGDQICWTITVNEPIGTVKVGGEIWQRQGPPRSSSACTVYAYDQPYSRFYGADVFGGGGFSSTDDTCTAINPDAIVLGPMRGFDAGSGAQLAVFALGQINGVQPLSRSTRSPLQLAFSNQPQPDLNPPTNVNGNQFGGGFGSVTCAENYFAGIPDNTSWVPTNNVDISGLASGRYYYEGDVSIYGQLPDDATEGRRVVIYVDGNVSLRADSTAAGTGKVGYANNTEWTSLELIPSLYVIANGNIFIDDGVTELDGAYVSQGGEIFTCAIGFDAPTVAQLTEQCRTQLQVNGTFLANKVNLWRTFGSLRESYPLEVPVRDPTPADPAPTDPPSSRAAEIFIYNPTLWFTEGGNLPSNSKIQIDSYNLLPPSL